MHINVNIEYRWTRMLHPRVPDHFCSFNNVISLCITRHYKLKHLKTIRYHKLNRTLPPHANARLLTARRARLNRRPHLERRTSADGVVGDHPQQVLVSGQQVGGRVRVDVSADTVGPRPARQRLHVPLLDEVRLDGRAAVTGRGLPGDRNGMFEDLTDDQRTAGG